MGFTINEAVGGNENAEEDSGERKTAVGFSLSTSLSKTNLPDMLSECVPSWHNAYWQRVSKMRDVPCVFWRNFVTVGERLCAYQIFLTWSQQPKLDPRAGKELENMIFYEFAVRLVSCGSAADVPGLVLLTPHVYGYVGEKNTCISHMSEAAAAASLITLPAIYTL